MRICIKCHENLGCEATHPLVVLHCGEVCGVCSGAVTGYDCVSPIANEIASYNRAVALFTLSMRAKFVMNLKEKGGWQKIPWDFAIKALNKEVGELAAALLAPVKGSSDFRAIIDESADVANFALFFADRAHNEDASIRAIRARMDAEQKTPLGAEAK